MRLKVIFLLVQYISLSLLYNIASANPLIGETVRHAHPNEYPFVASVVTVLGESYNPVQDQMCSGTLITPQDILTSKICLENRLPIQVNVYLGSHILSACQRYFVSWWVNYYTWTLHKEIHNADPSHDLSILRLASQVNNVIPAIILPYDKSSMIGAEVHLPSWTKTYGETENIMTTASVIVIPDSQCVNQIRELCGYTVGIDEYMICSIANPYVLLSIGNAGAPVIYNGKVVAVSKATCPAGEFHPHKVNAHYNLDFFVNFILDVTRLV